MVLIVFGRSLFQGYAPLDDPFLIVNNLAIRGLSFENLWLIFTSYDPEIYIPFTLFTYQISYMIGELNPFGYHLVNLLFHSANAILVVSVMMKLTKNKAASIFVGLIFAIHPINTQVAVWITGRKDLLYTLFFLLSFLQYIRFRSGNSRVYIWSIICLVLAILAKPMAVTLPAVLVLYDMFFGEQKIEKKYLKEMLPYFALSLIFIVIAIIGKERIVGSTPIWEILIMSEKSITFYLQKFFLPTGLSIFYPYRGEITLLSLNFIIPTLITVALIAIAVRSFRRKPWAAFGILFFLITLSPTFFNIKTGGVVLFATDRYAYLPLIGILFLIAKVIDKYKFNPRYALATGGIVIALFSLLAMRQTKVWDTPEGLFMQALEAYPESVSARTALSTLYRESGQYEKAFEVLKDGLEYDDHINLHIAAGTVYANVGQIPDAVDQFEKAMEMDPENPEPYFSLGSIREQTGNKIAAMVNYEQAVERDPSYVPSRTNLANLYFEQGRTEDALEQLEIALDWNPSSLSAHKIMVRILMEQGNVIEARKHVKKVLQLEPNNSEANSIYNAIKDL